MNPFFALTAVIEAATGLALIVAPEFVVRMLLGAELTGPGVPLGRLTGAALLALSVACGLARNDAGSHAAKAMLAAMLFYNVAAATVLGSAGWQWPTASALLWLAVGLHGILAVWCVALAFGAGKRA